MSVLALVLGIVSLVLGGVAYVGAAVGGWWAPLIIIAISIVGIIISAICMKKAKREGKKDGMAIAGLVMSIIGLVNGIIGLIVGITAAVFFGAIINQGGQQLTDQVQEQIQDVLNNLPSMGQ